MSNTLVLQYRAKRDAAVERAGLVSSLGLLEFLLADAPSAGKARRALRHPLAAVLSTTRREALEAEDAVELVRFTHELMNGLCVMLGLRPVGKDASEQVHKAVLHKLRNHGRPERRPIDDAEKARRASEAAARRLATSTAGPQGVSGSAASIKRGFEGGNTPNARRRHRRGQ